MKRILLIGIGGVYNYGCEAIVRGTENIIKQYNSDIVVDYASYQPKEDKIRLEGSSVNVIKRKINRYSLNNIVKKLFELIGFNYYIIRDNTKILKRYDAVFSIGGDIYTLNPDGSYAGHMVKFGDKCIEEGIPYVMWGCSIGPFEHDEKVLSVFKKHLSNITYIVAREEQTIKYLKSIGVYQNVEFAPDPAYFVESQIKNVVDNNKDQRIGINLSPLSARFMNMDRADAISEQTKVIKKIIDETNANIVLLPHVVTKSNIHDDDFRYLSEIYNALDDKYKQKVDLYSEDGGFIGVKKQIVNCNFVIGARMHCCINALASNTPAIFLSYSEKSRAMARLVYGHDKYVISLLEFMDVVTYLQEFSANFEDKVTEMQQYDFTEIFQKIGV